MPEAHQPRVLAVWELVALVAGLSALNAMSVDIMLPALPDIGRAFSLADQNDRQLVIVAYISSFGIAQLAYGPLADAFGRRSVLVWALGIFIAGSILCVAAPSFELFLLARALQGLGSAATRVISTAVVRDLVSGRRMAQIISMAMTVFMVIPIVAPSLGQLILFVAPWRWIFGALLIYALIILAWTLIRLPETLAAENRTPLQFQTVARSFRTVIANRQALGYMLASSFVMGGLFGYVTACEQIFVDVFHLGAAFPLAFASVAIAMSAGMAVNARLVMRIGMRRLAHAALIWFTALAALHAIVLALGFVSFWPYLILLSLTLGAFGLIGGNFNALAMDPLGRIAGSASALYGAVTATVGAVTGGFIASHFDGTPTPFMAGLAATGAASLLAVLWTEKGRLLREPAAGDLGQARRPGES